MRNRDADYDRAEARIKKEIDMAQLRKAKDALDVKNTLMSFLKQSGQHWSCKKSNNFVSEMTKRLAKEVDVPVAGYTKPLPVREPLPYFKTVAERKRIEYEVRSDDKVRFKKVDGSMSNWHSAKMANFYIKRRRVNK